MAGPRVPFNIKGITGELPYKEQIDVSAVKPYDRNSALRYLWARHRIAFLADYNRLSPNDERVREVTKSGLTKETTFTLAVDASGHVMRIQIGKGKFNNTDLGTCVIKHFEKLQFPPGKGSAPYGLQLHLSADHFDIHGEQDGYPSESPL